MTKAATGRLVVAVAEDYELVVLGLERIFGSHSDRLILTELHSDDAHRPIELVDIVLIDADTTLASNQTRIHRLLEDPHVRHVVVFRWMIHPTGVEWGLRCGVHGFVSKALPAADLVAALEDVAAGEHVIRGPAVASNQPDTAHDRGRSAGLSGREAEILDLIVQGLKNYEIAAATALSANTLKSYIRSLYRKIGVSTRSQAALWGLTNRYQRCTLDQHLAPLEDASLDHCRANLQEAASLPDVAAQR